MIDENTLRKWASELGFADTALCGTADFEAQRQRTLSQPPIPERKQLRFYPEVDYPQAKSLAVLLWGYAPALQEGGETLFIDSYYQASNAAYHAACELEKRLLDAGCFAKANVSYPAKEAAVRCGLGTIAKNDLLLTEQFGTRVVIILMAVGIEKSGKRSDVFTRRCLDCGRCVKACPSDALDQNGMSHPERCMRNFMMEGVVAPEHLRKRMGMRLIGCDICQSVCPVQPVFEQKQRESFTLDRFVTGDQAFFSQSVADLAAKIGRNAARPQRIRAQAAILAGNSGNPAYLPVLNEWTQLPFEAVKEHALWAIEQIRQKSGALDHEAQKR